MTLGSLVLMKFLSWLCLLRVSASYRLSSNDVQRRNILRMYSSRIESPFGRPNQ